MTAVAFAGRYHTLVAECTDRTMVLKDCCVVHNILPRTLLDRGVTWLRTVLEILIHVVIDRP